MVENSIATEKSEINSREKMKFEACFHCGDPCDETLIVFDDKKFCCNGCKTVYEILDNSGMCAYYLIDENAGFNLKAKVQAQYAWLEDEDVIERLVDYRDEKITKLSFFLPQIHCAACVWLLENLHKFSSGITFSRVNFPKKEIHINFENEKTNLRKVVELLDSIGYTPSINMSNLEEKVKKVADKSLYYKLGFLGFAFGNVMLFTFPEYLGLFKKSDDSFFKFFSVINMLISVPVVFYGGSDYFRSAYLGLKKKKLNLDVPIALGMLAIFLWSVYETMTGIGHGYYDSLAGLLFFLLLGKWFQQKTYYSIEFDRDYKSYFPIAITKKENGVEKTMVVDKIQPGDVIVVRANELIPADGILTKGKGNIDYSFVTGESNPTYKEIGQKIFAGGKQLDSTIEITIIKKVSQSYLTQLWNDTAFEKSENKPMSELADRIGTNFTIYVLVVAFGTLFYWLYKDPHIAVFAFAAVLIVACPCAVALSIPFTFGNGLRILSSKNFFLKNTGVFESIQKIDRVVFDKTGTLTHVMKNEINYEGTELSPKEKSQVKSLAYHSSHPLSRQIFDHLHVESLEMENYEEKVGYGILGKFGETVVKIGSSSFVDSANSNDKSGVYIKIGDEIKGKFTFSNFYREGLSDLVKFLNAKYKLSLISGDSDSEKENLLKIFPANSELLFDLKPKDKLDYIADKQSKGERILFVGDGLNDAGALQKSNVGVVITENINNFTPASDAILSADRFASLKKYLEYILDVRKLVLAAYLVAFVYNIIGISYATTGRLSPLVAAILMPLSSISVVLFGVLSSTYLAKRKKII